MLDYIGVVSIWGEEGTCKSTFALTFPPIIRHFDIDVGGYARAAWRLSEDVRAGIRSKSYPLDVIQIDKMMGAAVRAGANNTVVDIRFPKRVVGMRELWQRIIIDFVEACRDPIVQTIIFDSATLMWTICHNSHLQEVQEKQLAQGVSENSKEFREKLLAVEFGPANDKFRTVVHTARSFKKNVVMVHYPTDEYGAVPDGNGGIKNDKTGRKVPDGMKEIGKMADLVLNTYIKTENGKSVPKAKILKCGIPNLGLSFVGMEIEANFAAISQIYEAMSPQVGTTQGGQ